jgi:hypothetical protein
MFIAMPMLMGMVGFMPLFDIVLLNAYSNLCHCSFISWNLTMVLLDWHVLCVYVVECL